MITIDDRQLAGGNDLGHFRRRQFLANKYPIALSVDAQQAIGLSAGARSASPVRRLNRRGAKGSARCRRR
jgi:hypothetical protein